MSKPRSTKDCWQPPESGDRPGQTPQSLQREPTCRNLISDSSLRAAVISSLAWGTLSGSPRKWLQLLGPQLWTHAILTGFSSPDQLSSRLSTIVEVLIAWAELLSTAGHLECGLVAKGLDVQSLIPFYFVCW